MSKKFKSPFVDASLIKAINSWSAKDQGIDSRIPASSPLSAQKKDESIEIQSRSTTILPIFVSKTFKVHNGKKFIIVKVTEKIVGQKFGEFARTRTRGKDPRPKTITRR